MINYSTAIYEVSAGTSNQLLPSTLPEIAFSGRSNVGKSSLLNRILGRKALARVSSVPGKTVTINFFKLDYCRFVDLPGYGYAKVKKEEKLRWAELMEGYFSSGRNIKLVVQLVDLRHKPSELDLQMIEFMSSNSIPFIVVMTKADKLNKTERKNCEKLNFDILSRYGDFPIIPFSALNGEGVTEIRNSIENSLV